MNKKHYNRSVERADASFTRWCKKEKIRLHSIQHVVTWEDWDKGIGVYFFLERITDVESLKKERKDEMKEMYLSHLEKYDYPFEKFPEVVFEIDSDENVRKKYNGSYFFRLR